MKLDLHEPLKPPSLIRVKELRLHNDRGFIEEEGQVIC